MPWLFLVPWWDFFNIVNFPEPLGKISAGYVWDAGDIRRWAVKHRPDRSNDIEP